jgi:hypothetical protein
MGALDVTPSRGIGCHTDAVEMGDVAINSRSGPLASR